MSFRSPSPSKDRRPAADFDAPVTAQAHSRVHTSRPVYTSERNPVIMAILVPSSLLQRLDNNLTTFVYIHLLSSVSGWT